MSIHKIMQCDWCNKTSKIYEDTEWASSWISDPDLMLDFCSPLCLQEFTEFDQNWSDE